MIIYRTGVRGESRNEGRKCQKRRLNTVEAWRQSPKISQSGERRALECGGKDTVFYHLFIGI